MDHTKNLVIRGFWDIRIDPIAKINGLYKTLIHSMQPENYTFNNIQYSQSNEYSLNNQLKIL